MSSQSITCQSNEIDIPTRPVDAPEPKSVCMSDGYPRGATYGSSGTPEYCHIHKTENMIKFREERRHKHWVCIIPNDMTRASYGYPGDDKPRYCSLHRTEGMINLRAERRNQRKEQEIVQLMT